MISICTFIQMSIFLFPDLIQGAALYYLFIAVLFAYFWLWWVFIAAWTFL